MKNKIDAREISMNYGPFQTELEKWKQMLTSRMEENILLKSKLTYILKNNYDQSSLEEIEEFQTMFLKEDELIDSLRRDVYELYKIFEEGKSEKFLDTRIKDFRRDIDNSSVSFSVLKTAFNDFQKKISYSNWDKGMENRNCFSYYRT